MGFIEWLESNMLSCSWKSNVGIECPGCGFQRAFILLLKGEVVASIEQYPALIPILFTFGLLVFHISQKRFNLLKPVFYSFLFSTGIVVVSYIIKMSHQHAAFHEHMQHLH